MVQYILQLNPVAAAGDPLDGLLIATIVLFILSTITEKFTTLVRMYPGQFRIIGLAFCLVFYYLVFNGIFSQPKLGNITGTVLLLFNTLMLLVIWGNTTGASVSKWKFTRFLSRKFSVLNNVSKETDTASKTAEEREVTILSFMIGLIVAFLFNANLFNFFDTLHPPGLRPASPFAKSPLFALDPAFFNVTIITVIGFLLTAFFLAFGAKFFHDLLDNLLQIKNYKKKLNEKADWDFTDIKEFDKYMSEQEQGRYEEFLKQQLNKPGIFFESDYANRTVTVYLTVPATTVADKLFYKTSLGKIWEIMVLKKESRGIRALSTPLFPSSQMANQIPFNNALKGSLGYFVKARESNNVFLLTCYHVVWNEHDWDHFKPIGRENIVHPLNGSPVGEIHVALKNNLVDAVLIKPTNISMHGNIDGIGEVLQDRALNDGDKNLTVRMRGNTSGNREGFIAELNKGAHITYPDGRSRFLDNLILIKTRDGKPFSKEGDSGALLVDNFGFAIGMVVAGDEQEVSLAIPFSNLKSQLNIEIFKTA